MKNSEQIKDFILKSVEQHPRDVSRLTAERFGLNRRSVMYHLQKLIGQRILIAEGRTKARIYRLRVLAAQSWTIDVGLASEEHRVWATTVAPHLNGLKDNIRSICQHGFTEMFNNVIDHSESARACVDLEKEMFESFSIASGELVYSARASDEDDWLFEFAKAPPIRGTSVHMSLSLFASRTPQEVFDRFSGVDAGFSKTHVPVALARYGDDKLVSRSQARRVLARFEKFREVSLDFKGVSTIGQPFADEIFCVFVQKNPSVQVSYVHATPQIQQMIAWVRGARGMQGPLL